MLRQRILTAIVAGLLLLAVLFAAPAALVRALLAAVILVAAWEWGAFLSPERAGVRYAYAAAIGALLALTAWLLGAGHLAATTVLVAALAWWLVALGWLFFYPTPVPRVLAAAGGVFVLLPAWLALDLLYRESAGLLLFLLLLVWSADIGAYFAGRRFGRVKLAPAVSPGKTWEGVLGGLVAVALVAAAGAQYFGIATAVLLPFCIAIGLVSIVGDLTVSVFKRSVGIKDSGKLFPGHGGLLDRIDSIAAAAPLFALGLAWVLP